MSSGVVVNAACVTRQEEQEEEVQRLLLRVPNWTARAGVALPQCLLWTAFVATT